jgi:hypothetical protein
MGYNKKKNGSFTYLMWWIFKKKKINQDMNSDRLSVAVVEFVIIDVVCCFLQNNKKE